MCVIFVENQWNDFEHNAFRRNNFFFFLLIFQGLPIIKNGYLVYCGGFFAWIVIASMLPSRVNLLGRGSSNFFLIFS